MVSAKGNGACATNLFDLGDERLGGSDADSVDVDGDTHVSIALMQDDGDAAPQPDGQERVLILADAQIRYPDHHLPAAHAARR